MLQRQKFECVHRQFAVLPWLHSGDMCIALGDNNLTRICFPDGVWFRLLPDRRKAKLQSDRLPIGTLPVGMLLSQPLQHHHLNLTLNPAIAGIVPVFGQRTHAA